MSSYGSPQREHSASAKDRVVDGEGGRDESAKVGDEGWMIGEEGGSGGRAAGRLIGGLIGRLAGRLAGRRAGDSGAVGSGVDAEATGSEASTWDGGGVPSNVASGFRPK